MARRASVSSCAKAWARSSVRDCWASGHHRDLLGLLRFFWRAGLIGFGLPGRREGGLRVLARQLGALRDDLLVDRPDPNDILLTGVLDHIEKQADERRR
jgi:hypothetical protein